MAKLLSAPTPALTELEIQYLDGMKVTFEKVSDGMHDMGSSVQNLQIGQAEVQDRVNAMYTMLGDCKRLVSFSNIPLVYCLIAFSLY